MEPARQQLRERGGPHRQGDEQCERSEERVDGDRAREVGTRQDSEENREQGELTEHQHRRDSEKTGCRAPGEPREHDDVVDAGAEEHQQDADEQSAVVRDEPRETEHEDRDEDEVQDQDRDEEAHIAERPADLGERHGEERREQQEDQRGGDERLERARASRNGEPDRTADEHPREVQRDLPAVRPRDHLFEPTARQPPRRAGASA